MGVQISGELGAFPKSATAWYSSSSMRFFQIEYNVLCIHWRIQGAPPPPTPPQQDQFLSFLHTFLLKSVRIEGWRPPQRVSAPSTENPGSATGIH